MNSTEGIILQKCSLLPSPLDNQASQMELRQAILSKLDTKSEKPTTHSPPSLANLAA